MVFLSCFELHVALRAVTGSGKRRGRCQNVTVEEKNCDEYFIEHHWKKPQPAISERQNQRSDQMSNGPRISFEDAAILGDTCEYS